MSPSYWKLRKQKRLERSRKGVAARLRKLAAMRAGLPVRKWELVRRITDEAPRRTRTIVEVWVMELEYGKLKTKVTANGTETKFRSLAGALKALGKIP